MNEIDRLSATVAKLGAAPEPRTRDGRVLSGADPQGLVEAVLAEIDETVLGRELRLRNDRGEEIRLEVSGRRLLRMASVAPKELADTCASMIGKPIVDADGPASGAVAEVLWAMATDSPAFAVISRKLSRRPDPAQVGCSAEALRASWKRRKALSRRAGSPDVADFVTRISAYSSALVRFEEGRVVQQEGPHDSIRHLTHLSRIESLEEGHFSPRGGAEAFVLVSSATGGGDAILYARDETQALLAQFPARLTAAILTHWLGSV